MRGPERVRLAEGYSISRVIVGGWQFSAGHGAHRSGRESEELLAQLVDSGFTTFDCADIYTGVEELLGRMLTGRRAGGRSTEIQIHTKFVPDLEVLDRIDRSYVAGVIHRSLRRLGVECLDLVQFHWWDFSFPRYLEVAHWLEELRAEGKIRFLGVTNFDKDRLEELVSSGLPIVSNQVQYSVLDRRPEAALSDYCQAQGLSLLCYGALAGGFLSTGYLGQGEPPTDSRNRSLVKYRLIIDEVGGWKAYQDILGVLGTVARRHGVSIPSVALSWVLGRPAVAATITGVDSVDQATELLQLFRLSLDSEDLGLLQVALAGAPGPRGPVYGLERDRDGPHGRIMRYNLNRE
jgi:aryl-alcohol dehydrogenase-like predicted oxidoreductase